MTQNRKRLANNDNDIEIIHRKSINRTDTDEGSLITQQSISNNYSFRLVPAQKKIISSQFSCTEKEIAKFDKISTEAQAQCIKSVERLFIFKGSRRELITRNQVADTLSKVDVDYKKHVNVVLCKVRDDLKTTFGYAIVAGSDIVGFKDGRKDDYFVSSTIFSPSLLCILASSDRNAAYHGFMTLVLYSIITSSGQKQACKDILAALRLIDSRFPQDINIAIARDKSYNASILAASSTAASSHALSIPELGDEFLGLIFRMKKEQYLLIVKDDKGDGTTAGDAGKAVYTLGPRFYLDIGKRQLVKSYFLLTGRPMDDILLRDIELQNEQSAEKDV